MQNENNSAKSDLESFLRELRKIPFTMIKLSPEAEDSELDWPYEDKYGFYQQAFVLNAIECNLNKKLTGSEFTQLLENKVKIKAKIGIDSYILNNQVLFTVALKEDVSGNFYHNFQPQL
ncbi:MAG: hypothetical protein ACPGTQ_09820 [Colwellia sp.]